ncbi:MAG: 3',5'-cyclic-nucleotide phosphodiesterase [Chlamydiales bacterium]|nr:3',5'-cyclic-nucleotide phosphodiesterase [Chlamydiales bacterium]
MDNAFQVVVLGCTGGPREGNLSCYLLSSLKKESQWIAFDAGTLLAGIDAAVLKKSFETVPFSDSELTPSGEVLRNHLKAYLISHTHLDHIAALVLNSQIDTSKYILGIDPTIDNLRDHIFNGRVWPNYGDEGHEPILSKYHYVRLPLHQPVPIPDTSMHVEAYLLSHPRGYPSTAFLIESEGDYMLYFGDTSSDSLEVEKHLARIWKRIAPLICEGKFKGMLLECSYSHKEADQVIFGHLDTKLMMLELHRLADLAQTSLEGLNVVVTHRKENIKKGEDLKETIARELTELNDLGVNFIFPEQGNRILL